MTIMTRNAVVSKLLAAILETWKLVPTDELLPGGVVLIERGLLQPPSAGVVIWLSPMPLVDEVHVEVPIDLTVFFHQMEKVFFEMPRQHLRMSMPGHPVDLNARNGWVAGKMYSLSDRGARIAAPVHLAKGEPVHLDFFLGRQNMQIEGEVLYDIPEGDTPGREHAQVGVLFKLLPDPVRLVLRRHIERMTLKQACDRCGVSPASPSLSWFDRGTSPWSPPAGKR